MLIILAGLPGTGKTTIARALARRLAAVHVRIDSIEEALRSSGSLPDGVGAAGYLVGYRVAEDNLRVGRIVVADSVNPLRLTRDAWRSVAWRADTASVEVEIACSDAGEHRRRVETRRPDIAGFTLPTWQDVVTRDYEAWDRPCLVIDTACTTVEQAVAAILTHVGEQDQPMVKTQAQPAEISWRKAVENHQRAEERPRAYFDAGEKG